MCLCVEFQMSQRLQLFFFSRRQQQFEYTKKRASVLGEDPFLTGVTPVECELLTPPPPPATQRAAYKHTIPSTVLTDDQ